MKKIIPAILAILTGLLVLAGYFLKDQLGPVLSLIFSWAILLAGAAGLLGVANLLAFHIRKIIGREQLSFFSMVTLAAFLLAFIAGLVLTPQSSFFRNLILNVQIPVEASLLALLAVTLSYASMRLIRVRGWSPFSIAFLLSVIVFLILDLGFFSTHPGSIGGELVGLLRRLPVAGARGILMGMALGGLVVGLRVLLAIDKPYGGD